MLKSSDDCLTQQLRSYLTHAAGADGLLALALFGSRARGGFDDRSDVDVLVVVPKTLDSPAMRRHLRRAARECSPLVSLAIFTPHELRREVAERPSFVAHLAQESVTLYDSAEWDGLATLLRSVPSDAESFRCEAAERAEDLTLFVELEPFRGQFIVYVASLYGLAKEIVIAKLASDGVHEYDWRNAFKTYGELEPRLRNDLDHMATLRPYYEFARSGRRRGVRHSPGEREAQRALAAVQRIAGL